MLWRAGVIQRLCAVARGIDAAEWLIAGRVDLSFAFCGKNSIGGPIGEKNEKALAVNKYIFPKPAVPIPIPTGRGHGLVRRRWLPAIFKLDFS